MSGTWTSQNKILPGAYVSFLTNTVLSITPGERGIVVLLQEMSTGTAGDQYMITATDKTAYPSDTTQMDKLLVDEALKGAQTVIVYNLGTSHTAQVIETALNELKTLVFHTICYPYENATYASNQSTIAKWIEEMRKEEGLKVQAVLADYQADNEAIINVTQGVKLSDGTIFTSAQTTAWVSGVTAGASISQSITGKIYLGVIDVVPRMTKREMEIAVAAGEFIFKVDTAENVTAVYDINSLTTYTVEKGKIFRKNRVIRTLDGIDKDIVQIFESNYIGKINNTADGRSLLRATLVQYFNELQRLQVIMNFTQKDIEITQGNGSDAVVIDCYIQPVDSVEKIYITVNLA
ncbi:MAG: phage tail sheath C-terminal domain-containing protein [Velocimicrobium sp.]